MVNSHTVPGQNPAPIRTLNRWRDVHFETVQSRRPLGRSRSCASWFVTSNHLPTLSFAALVCLVGDQELRPPSDRRRVAGWRQADRRRILSRHGFFFRIGARYATGLS